MIGQREFIPGIAMSKQKRHVVCPRCDSVNAVPVDRPAEAAKCGRCQARLFSGEPVELDGARLEKHIARSDLPVIVDFWAPWCGPCRAMAPVFADVAKGTEPRARFVKVNVDDNPDAASRYGIRGIPALLAFSGGKVSARQTGATDAATLRRWIEQLT